MKVNEVEFVISAMGLEQLPEDALPEIALAGRSNVGKSSLINRMLQRKAIARTSATPGKTQQLNYYRVNGSIYFVDFPGYGFAKVSKSLREKWGQLIESYILKRQPLKLLLLIVDIRHPPTADDQMMFEWLKHHNVPVCIVATKADKISRGRWPQHVKITRETLDMEPGDPLVLFSSETGLGRDELWAVILNSLENER